MTKRFSITHLHLVLLLCLSLPWPSSARDFFLQEGTEVILILHTTVDTKISRSGDRIIATVQDPILLDNIEVIPHGARVLGRVGEISKPGRFGRGGKLILTFESIDVPGSGQVQIAGSLVDIYDPEDLDDPLLRDVDIGSEGEVQASGPRKLKRVGSVVGGGAIGAAAGAGLGAAIGVAAGAGVAYVWFKGKHVEVPAGTGLIMRVDRGVTVSVPNMPAVGSKPTVSSK